MRVIFRFLARMYWQDLLDTLVASIVVLLISLFFANFEQILPLYDPLATEVPNSHPGIMGMFQIIVWPAWVSTIVSIITSLVKLVRSMIVGPKKAGKNQRNVPSPGAGRTD